MITILGTILFRLICGEYYFEKIKDDESASLLTGAIFTTEMLTVSFIGIIYKIHKWLKRS